MMPAPIPLHPSIDLHVEGRISRSDAERQRRTAEELLRRLETRPGQILADEVGMGKTFVALAVAASVVLASKCKRQVVVMAPPSVLGKWERDFHTFTENCLDGDAGLRCAIARRPVEFLKLLDDPPHRRSHVIFIAHRTMGRRLHDRWVKLALLRESIKGRWGAAEMRERLARFVGRLLGIGWVDRAAPDAWRDLLAADPADWLDVLRKHGIGSTKDEAPEDADDPVPAHVAELLRELDLGAVYETLRDGLPVRESANTRARLRRLRKALDDVFADVWEAVLAGMRYRFPLLIVDEAHHLKNAHTRVASLFRSAEPDDESDEPAHGALAGRFERMLFLTATPFQLGHHELCNVLERFGGIAWDGAAAPPGGPDALRQAIEALRERLDRSQRAALALDRAWGELTHDDLCVDGRTFSSPDEWWAALRAGGEGTPAAQRALARFDDAERAIRAAEAALREWIIRHSRPTVLCDAHPHLPRRVRRVGRAIRDALAHGAEEGLPVEGDAVLPFLLAARLVATTPESRPVFAEGLASSYEAFLKTRKHAGNGFDGVTDDEEPLEAPALVSHARWYLDAIERALADAGSARETHPKVSATVDRVIELWSQGEKVLVFCHYLATGDVLRHAIAERVQVEIVRRAAAMLGCSETDAAERLEQLTENRFAEGSTATQAVYEETGALLEAYPALVPYGTRLLEIARRFIRRPSFLVRYFDLGTAHFGRDDVQRAFRRSAGSGMQIAKVFETFFEFLARRCGDREREAYISAVEHIQTGDIRVGERGEPDASTTLGANVRLINGGTDAELRDRLLLAFNTPFYPEVLITTSVMAEGVDLHLNCRHVIHHDLSWNPSTLEQRTGRVDRIGARAEHAGAPIEVAMPFVAATQDEKMYRVVTDRERWFNVVMGGEAMLRLDARSTDRAARRVPIPEEAYARLKPELGVRADVQAADASEDRFADISCRLRYSSAS